MGSLRARGHRSTLPSPTQSTGHGRARGSERSEETPAEERIRQLQRLAGNVAVTELVTGRSRSVVQRRPEDEEKEPDVPPPTTTPAAPDPANAGQSPAPADAGPTPAPAADAGPATAAPGPTTTPGPNAPGTTPTQTGPGTAGTGPGAPGPATPGAGTPGPAATPGPSFARDAGLDLEAAAAPGQPAAGTFTADEKATLPATEPLPDLTSLGEGKPFWNDATAKSFAEKLAETYASRGLTDKTKVDKAAKLAELETDFDSVVKGFIFGRSGYSMNFDAKKFDSRWAQLPTYLAGYLQKQRGEILTKLKTANNKLPKDSRASDADLDKSLELKMQKERFDVLERLRHRVAIGSWGWMAERREKLDFETIKQKPTGKFEGLAENLTTEDMRGVIRDLLAAKKKSLSDAEKDKVIAAAQTAKNAAAKKAGTPATDLTDDEKGSAIAKAEFERLKANKLDGDLKTELIKARTKKDEANLVLPTTKDVKGWDGGEKNTVRIHKDLVTLLQVLEKEFPKGFRAGTYAIKVEGDHASQGFQGRFKSLDMYPNGGTAETQTPFGKAGFFDKQIAYDFGLAIDRAVAGKGTCQILYNDFVVARELNKVLKNGKVSNIDNVTADGGGAANLNWHGPLVTHFHVDFSI